MSSEKLDYFGCDKMYSCDGCECYIEKGDLIQPNTFLCCKYCFNCIICCDDCINNKELGGY